MKNLSIILFAVGALVLLSGGYWAFKMLDNVQDNAEQFFIPAIALFAAACAAQMIWGERRSV